MFTCDPILYLSNESSPFQRGHPSQRLPPLRRQLAVRAQPPDDRPEVAGGLQAGQAGPRLLRVPA